jgi:hypothetical protein
VTNPLDMDDLALRRAIETVAAAVSAFNAAEGSAFFHEQADREAAVARLRELTAEANRRGMKVDLKDYLL